MECWVILHLAWIYGINVGTVSIPIPNGHIWGVGTHFLGGENDSNLNPIALVSHPERNSYHQIGSSPPNIGAVKIFWNHHQKAAWLPPGWRKNSHLHPNSHPLQNKKHGCEDFQGVLRISARCKTVSWPLSRSTFGRILRVFPDPYGMVTYMFDAFLWDFHVGILYHPVPHGYCGNYWWLAFTRQGEEHVNSYISIMSVQWQYQSNWKKVTLVPGNIRKAHQYFW